MSTVTARRPSRSTAGSGRRRSPRPTIGVTAVVVSHNCAHYLRRALEALRGQREVRLQVVVVDNASHDDSCDLVRQEFPEVELVASPDNLGLSGGANRGIELARHPFVCTMNEDVELAPDALSVMATHLARHPEVGAVGPQLRNSDGSLQPSGAPLPTPADVIASRYHLPRSWARGRDFDGIRAVGVIPGACLMVSRPVLAEVGSYDQSNFFVNWEDVDWCHRIAAAGYQIHYLPAARAIHHLGASTATDSAIVSLTGRTGALRYFAKHRSRLAARLVALALLPGDLLSVIVHSLQDVFSFGRRRRGRLTWSILAATWWKMRLPSPSSAGASRSRLRGAARAAVQRLLRLPGATILAEAAARLLGRRWPDAELAVAPRFQIVESLQKRRLSTIRVVRLPGGPRLTVDIADYWGRKLYFCSSGRLDGGWIYEVETTRFLAGWLRDGDTFIDVGANAGYFSILAASWVGPAGRVHAFEPHPAAHRLLERSTELNGLSGRLLANPTAVGTSTGSTRLWLVPDPKASDIASTMCRQGWIPVAVAATTLDDYCRAQKIEQVRLLKIDVEGAELEVLAGAPNLFRRIRPEAVICEFAPAILPDPVRVWRQLVHRFAGYGYSPHDLDASGAAQLRDAAAPDWDWGNVCFLPNNSR